MISILADHDIEGHAYSLFGVLGAEGWLEMVDLRLVTFTEVGLPFNSSDQAVWRFAQESGMILLTNNRNMDGEDSLEQTLRNENTPSSLPIMSDKEETLPSPPLLRTVRASFPAHRSSISKALLDKETRIVTQCFTIHT